MNDQHIQQVFHRACLGQNLIFYLTIQKDFYGANEKIRILSLLVAVNLITEH